MKDNMTAYAKTKSRISGWGVIPVLTSLLLFASCQHETETANRGILEVAQVSMGAETVIETRANTISGSGTGYSPIESVMSINVKIFAFDGTNNTRKQPDDDEGTFLCNKKPGANEGEYEYEWSSSLDAEDENRYNLFAYSLDGLCTSASLATNDNDGVNAVLTMNGLKVITESDPMVSVAAAGGNDNSGLLTDFTEGSYNIGTVAIKSVGTHDELKTKVWLAMQHLYAKAMVKFKVDAGYDKIRTVKLKSAVISTVGGGVLPGNSTYNYSTRTISWSASNYNGDAITLDLMDPEGVTTIPLVYEDPDAEEKKVVLGTTAVPFAWFCFLPKQTPSISLTVTYDVYDKAGKCIRKDQSVTNANLLSVVPAPDQENPANGLIAGNDYMITVCVKPTYLYQLSDGDAPLELIIE